jgi:hypothetical protein
MCGGESDSNSVGATCRGFSYSQPTKGISTDGITPGGSTCGANGTSARSATQWSASDRFCQATAQGGGCAPGNVCVPKLSVPTCELADGAVACDAGYTAVAGPWYTGFTDGRSCSCACGSPSGGSCGATFSFYTSNDCSGSAGLTMSASQSQCNVTTAFHSVRLTGGALPSCGAAGATVSGALSGSGQQTLCCRP